VHENIFLEEFEGLRLRFREFIISIEPMALVSIHSPMQNILNKFNYGSKSASKYLEIK